MPENKNNKQADEAPETITVPVSALEAIQKQMLDMEVKIEEQKGMIEGMKQIKDIEEAGEGKLKKKRTYEPSFRTVRLRKYPVNGDFDNQDYVIGWTKRGAYREIDKTGMVPEIVDCLEIVFLKTPDKFEKVRLLDFLNSAEQVNCKIVDIKKNKIEKPTGEEIDTTTFDEAHGLVATGEKIDGVTEFDNNDYVITIPGVLEPVTINEKFIN